MTIIGIVVNVTSKTVGMIVAIVVVGVMLSAITSIIMIAIIIVNAKTTTVEWGTVRASSDIRNDDARRMVEGHDDHCNQ